MHLRQPPRLHLFVLSFVSPPCLRLFGSLLSSSPSVRSSSPRMAAMDFPSGHINDLASSSASLHDSLHDGFYSPSPFDTSTFQLNPLSARPPHTDADLPHPPAISSSHFSLRNTSFHDGSHESTTSAASESSEATASGAAAPPKPADVIQVHDPNGEGDAASEFDEEDERVKTAEKNIAPYQVWRDILATCDGRDKAFVCSLFPWPTVC